MEKQTIIIVGGFVLLLCGLCSLFTIPTYLVDRDYQARRKSYYEWCESQNGMVVTIKNVEGIILCVDKERKLLDY